MNLSDIDGALTVAEAAKKLRTTVQTVYRWITNGTHVPGVGKVRLGGVRVGGHYVVPLAAIDQFLTDCNPAPAARPETPSATRRRREAEQRRAAELLSSKPRKAQKQTGGASPR
jgi:excisionase family DNA binding protein